MGGYRKQVAAGGPGFAPKINADLARTHLSRLFLVVALVLVLTACNLPVSGGGILVQPATGTPLQVNIDSPREGSVLPSGSYEVVFRGSGAVAIEKGELSVNSMVVTTLDNSEKGATQVVFRTNWTPLTGPGRYALRARVKDIAGRWSEYAEVTVTVGATATPTPTITITPTLSATPAVTATPLPSPSAVPTITPSATRIGAFGYRPQAWPDVFYTSGCTPDQVDFSVQVEPAKDVANLYLFTQLEDQAFGNQTGWGVPLAMAKMGDGQYTYSLVPARIPGGSGLYVRALLLVQFVAQDGSGSVISRSDVFAASTLVRCGERPTITVTPRASARQTVKLAPLAVPSSTPVKK
jgi:hypothetical protein